ncbi:MAG TPA: DUF3102 domain-containing protein [Opitutaceae bacterium]
MPKSKTNALTVVQSPELIAAPAVVAKLQKATIEQLLIVNQLGVERAHRAVFVGFLLTRVKASLKHGEWGAWQKENVHAFKKSTANHYMRLFAVFCESMEIQLPDLMALPVNKAKSLVNSKGNTPAHRFAAKLKEFVGERSLSELLDEHGIRDAGKVGGAREAGSSTPATVDPEALYQQSRDELGLILSRAEEAFLKENRLQHLAGHPEEVLGVVTGLRALADKVEAAAQPLIKV